MKGRILAWNWMLPWITIMYFDRQSSTQKVALSLAPSESDSKILLLCNLYLIQDLLNPQNNLRFISRFKKDSSRNLGFKQDSLWDSLEV